MRKAFAIASILTLAVAMAIQAAVPQLINYQGFLTDAAGDPVADGPYQVKFIIWDDPVSTDMAMNEVWNSEFQTVNTVDGLFEYKLGSNVSLPDFLFNDTIRWLGITVGADPENTPRSQLVSAPYSFNSQHADLADLATFADSAGAADILDSLSSEDFSRTGHSHVGAWTDDGTVVRLNTILDSVGIGTATPTEKLEVSGNIKASGTIQSGTSIIIDGVNDKITASSGTIDFDNENLVTTGKATIGPGHTNTGTNAFVAGVDNTAADSAATVSGGRNNNARGIYSVIAGGGGGALADSNTALGV